MSAKAIQLLKNEIIRLEKLLPERGAVEEIIKEKEEYERAIKMINFIVNNEIDINKRVVTLPSLNGHGYSTYRLMIDNEVDDVAQWTELREVGGELAEFMHGDKIITS